MASKEISPVTVAALRYLCTHGTATMADLRASVPDLKAKTMSNLIDMTMVVSAGHACYTITTKGRQRVAKADAEAKAAEQPAAVQLSSQQMQAEVVKVLTFSTDRLTLQQLSERLCQPVLLMRGAVADLVKRGAVVSTQGKTPHYRLPNESAAPAKISKRKAKPDHYTCPELDRNPGIGPERFVAYALPSRVGQRLHWPDGRVTAIDAHPGVPA